MHQSAEIQGVDERAESTRFAENSGIPGAIAKVGSLALIGAALPFMFADWIPRDFVADARVRLDSASAVSVAAATDALHSRQNLDNVIRALNLGAESEFAVTRPNAVSLVSDIVRGSETTVAQAESSMRDRLAKALQTGYDGTSGSFAISVKAQDASEAARVANMFAGIFQSELAAAGTREPDPLVEKLRQTLDRAEAAKSGFLSEFDEPKRAELRHFDAENSRISGELNEAAQNLAEVRRKLAFASPLKLEDVLTKPLPDSLEFTGLEYGRQRYMEAELLAGRLSSDLGPRHPRLLSANSMLADARNRIQVALKQLNTSLAEQEAASVKQVALLEQEKVRVGSNKEVAASIAKLAALETAAREARENYSEALSRSQARTAAPSTKATLTKLASIADARPLGLSLGSLAGMGAIAGFCLGSLLAFFTRRKPEELELFSEADMEDLDLLAMKDDLEELQDERFVAANDEPAKPDLSNDLIEELLMANRRPANEPLPSLLALAAEGKVAQQPAYAFREQRRQTRLQEVREFRNSMDALREQVTEYELLKKATGR